MSADPTELVQGTRIAGRFVVEQRVRQGELAAVYVVRAETSTTARYVARVIKLLGASANVITGLNRELQRVASLRQRAIPTLTVVAADPAGLVVVTERADGQSLRDVLRKNGRLKGSETARLVTEIAAALDAMHGASPAVIHRAISPENLSLADRMLRVWVEEAGLAHAMAATGLLPKGAAPSPIAYLSPGELSQSMSPANDVFSLASVVYECLTGSLAFDPAAGGIDAMVGGVFPSVISSRGASAAGVDAVLKRAWSDSSYPSVGAFARELAGALAANPSGRGLPLVSARPRANTPETRAAGTPPTGNDSNKATLLGISPTTSGRDGMKATLVGVGLGTKGAPKPAVATGRVQGAVASASPIEAAENDATESRTVRQRRLSETTQRVEVPRIRPPGTEPADASRVKVPSPGDIRPGQRPVGRIGTTGGGFSPNAPSGVRLPSPSQPPQQTAAPQPTATPTSAQAAALFFSTATVVGPAPPVMTQRAVAPENEAPPLPAPPSPAPPSLPPPSPSPPSLPPPSLPASKITLMTGVGLHGSRPPEASPAAASADAVPLSERAWGEIEASLDDALSAESTASSPPLPDSPFGMVSADSFDIVSDDDFAPVVPLPRADTPVALDAPVPNVIALGEPDPAPPSGVPPMPRPVTPLSVPLTATAPQPVESVEQPVADATHAPPIAPVYVVAPNVVVAPANEAPESRPVLPAWAPLPEAPEEPSEPRGRRIALGVVALVALLTAVVGVGWYVTREPQVAAVADAGPVRQPPPIATAAGPDAAVVAVVADVTTSVDAVVVAAAEDAVALTVDAGVVVAAIDAGEPAVDRPSVLAVVDVARAPRRYEEEDDGTRRRPTSRELSDIEDGLQSAVLACITEGGHRRRVHVGVRYEGSSGRAISVRVASPYDDPPMGPCIESAVRARTVPPFESDHHSRHFTFDSH